MADYGLLSGLAQGLREGMGAYQDQKKAAQERALAERMKNLQMFTQGVQETPEGFAYTPEKLEEMKTEKDFKRRMMENDAIAKQIAMQTNLAQLQDLNEKRKSPENRFDRTALPGEKIDVQKVSERIQKRKGIQQALLEGLKKLEDPNESADQKRITGEQMIKTLNSQENPDAVGNQEADRLGGLLQPKFFNVGPWKKPGPAFGTAPIGEFAKQVKNKIDEFKGMLRADEETIQSIYERTGLIEPKQTGLVKRPEKSRQEGSAPQPQAAGPSEQQVQAFAKLNGLSVDKARSILYGRFQKGAGASNTAAR